MAKKKKKSGKRSYRRSKPTRRRGRGRGAKRMKFAAPNTQALYYGAAMAAGEVIAAAVSRVVDLPDWIPESALGLYVYGFYYGDVPAQQMAYGLIVAEFISDSGALEAAVDAVAPKITAEEAVALDSRPETLMVPQE